MRYCFTILGAVIDCLLLTLIARKSISLLAEQLHIMIKLEIIMINAIIECLHLAPHKRLHKRQDKDNGLLNLGR